MPRTSRRGWLVVVASLMLFFSGAASANSSTVDQSYEPNPTQGGVAVFGPQSVIQTFTAGRSGPLDRVDLLFSSGGGDPVL